jgi:glutaminyl-peptide cyclotransferase
MAMSRGRLIPALAVASLLLLGWLLAMNTVGSNAEPPGKAPEPPAPAKAREQFAADRAPAAASKPVAIDGERALGYLRALCKIGPRISGSEGMKKQQELLKAHFEKHGAKVEFQRFTARQASQLKPTEMANIIVSWHPDRNRRVFVCSHYDTRPKADQEQDPRRWGEPFVSANDGTSGVALCMELAHHMKQLPGEVGVDFVLFDGEEYVFDGPQGHDRYFFGSEHFADQYKRQPPAHRYAGAVLLDLFAGKTPSYPVEQNSGFLARGLVEEIWRIAAEQGVTAFKNQWGPAVSDDHLALNRAGIPAVDVIDFDYPHWHRLSDRPEQCSAESLANMAKVLTVWFQRAR